MDLTEAGTKKSLAVYVVRDPHDVPGIAALGPDPFSPDFDVDALAGILGSSSQQIKGVLRSQGIIAGIGNAYSDEILHAARISPFAIAKSLDRTDVQRLYDAIHSILGTAVAEATGQAAQRAQGHQAEPHAGPRPDRRTVPGMRGHGPGGFLRRYRPAVLPDVPDQEERSWPTAGRPAS